jgi:co-chaperonin GroES (HSP10)
MFVKPDIKPGETESGLVLTPEKFVSGNVTGVVTAVGDGVYDVIDISVGDRVAYVLAHATNFRHDGQTYTSVPAKAIFAVVLP